jgi:hypothetical protein
MTWRDLLENRQVQRHQTTRQEIGSLRGLVTRDLSDAGYAALSADRRFAIAYNAVLQLCKMAIACAGYRVSSGSGHHRNTLEAAAVTMGEAGPYADYFDACRRKRNRIDYDYAYVATDSEAEEILAKAREFEQIVETWIGRQHPEFKA